mgnify:FL=1
MVIAKWCKGNRIKIPRLKFQFKIVMHWEQQQNIELSIIRKTTQTDLSDGSQWWSLAAFR